MASNGLWENRLERETRNGAYQLSHGVHKLRPFNPERFAYRRYGL